VRRAADESQIDEITEAILEPFPDIERHACPVCGSNAAVGSPDVVLVCLSCASVWRPGS
jgi:hypothetical protein